MWSQQVLLVSLQQAHCTLGCILALGRSSSFFNWLFQFGLVGLCTLGVDQQGRASSFLNRLYCFGVVVLCTPGGLLVGEGPLHFSIRLFWFGVVGLSTLGLDQQGRASSFLNRLYWFGCSRSLYTWGAINGGGLPHFSIGDTWFGVVSHSTLGLDQQGRDSVVQQGYVHFGSMGGPYALGI